MLATGTMAPEFRLKDQRGDEVDLADFRGRNRVLLVFYPKDQTPGCTRQLCDIRDNFDALRDDDVVPLGINSDDAESHQAFIDAQNYQFQLLVDDGLRVSRAYEAATDGSNHPERTVYIVGKDGRIIFAAKGAPPTTEMISAIRSASDA